MLVYLVAATDQQGIADAMARGWERIAYNRFAIERGSECRVVRRIDDLQPLPGGTQMIKGSDYDTAVTENAGDLTLWGREKAAFDKFVADGHGEWVE